MSDPLSIMRGIYDAFTRGDIATVVASLDEHIEWNEAEHVTFWSGSAFRGADEVVQGLFARIKPTFGRTWKIHVDRLFGCGATVIMQGRYSGTAQATGRYLSPRVAHIWDLEGDRIVRFQQYTDTWLFAEATGVTPITVT